MIVPTPVATARVEPRLSLKPSKQTTLSGEVTVCGVGFVTGADIRLTLKPAPANTGYCFYRTDLPGTPHVPATIDHLVADRKLRTALRKDDVSVEMTEHVLAALAGMGIDNCRLEINGPEVPGMDGSALSFVEAIDSVGSKILDVPSRPFLIDESLSVSSGDAMLAAHPPVMDGLYITFNLDYSQTPGIGKQSFSLKITPETFREEIAPARTFVRAVDIQQLQQQGLGGGRITARDLLVFGDDGSVIDNKLRFVDECVRHKILDVVGDLAIFSRPIVGHVFAHKSGHQLNAALVRRLIQESSERETQELLLDRPLLDAPRIEQIIPHRFPFLLVDRVLLLDPNRKAVGIKNVSYNEPFFQGHWPGRPVMPGVLIIEAMAQLAGVMLTQWQEKGSFAMLASMNHIKLRRPVTPGDQLWLEASSIKVKSKTASLETRALVDREIVAEAQMNFMLVRDHEDEFVDR